MRLIATPVEQQQAGLEFWFGDEHGDSEPVGVGCEVSRFVGRESFPIGGGEYEDAVVWRSGYYGGCIVGRQCRFRSRERSLTKSV